MRYFPIMAHVGIWSSTAGDNPEFHADRRAAEAALAARKPARRPAGLLPRLLPEALRAALAARRERRLLEDAMNRLAETSPHLLDDIGMSALSEAMTMTDHAARRARDIPTPDPVMDLPLALPADLPVPRALPLPAARPAPAPSSAPAPVPFAAE